MECSEITLPFVEDSGHFLFLSCKESLNLFLGSLGTGKACILAFSLNPLERLCELLQSLWEDIPSSFEKWITKI